jgi:hypothetical protein
MNEKTLLYTDVNFNSTESAELSRVFCAKENCSPSARVARPHANGGSQPHQKSDLSNQKKYVVHTALAYEIRVP